MKKRIKLIQHKSPNNSKRGDYYTAMHRRWFFWWYVSEKYTHTMVPIHKVFSTKQKAISYCNTLYGECVYKPTVVKEIK